MEGRFVAYYRVSTEHQGANGNGMAAQRKAVEDYLNGGNWKLVAEFTEVDRASASTIGRNLKGHLQRRKSISQRLSWRSSIVSRAMWHSLPT
jgi:DNA invertase Pin-like site-specific DNA recombinase